MTTPNPFTMPIVPKQKDLIKQGTSLIDRSKTLKVKDEDSYIAAWSLVEAHDRAIVKVAEVFDPFVSGLHKMHKAAVALRDGFIKPLSESKSRLLAARVSYRNEQERLRKLEDEKKAEALRLQQKKELEREAKKTEKAGDVETAAVLREEAATLPLPMFASAPAVPKTAGSFTRKRWLFEITDPDKVEREYCEPDESKIRKVVDALGDKAPISGLRIWEEEKEHSRSAS